MENEVNNDGKVNGLIKLMDFDVPTKDFEEKTYIVLYKITDSDVDGFNGVYDVYTGRSQTYESIKNHLISGVDIDIHASKIITEIKLDDGTGDKKYFMIPFTECISIYAFFNSVKSYYNDEFDIEDYNDSALDTDERNNKMNKSREQIEYEEMIYESLKQDKFSISLKNDNKVDNV